MERFYTVDIDGYKEDLPILPLPNGISICFFNLHGNVELTEHCGKELAKLLGGCDVVLTAESKGLQLSHVIARELGQKYYAVCRKSKKLYMQDGIEATVQSITTGGEQTLYLSKHDANLLKGKKVAIVDDVVSTGGSLRGLEKSSISQVAKSIKRLSCLQKATRQTATILCILQRFLSSRTKTKNEYKLQNRHLTMPICIVKR